MVKAILLAVGLAVIGIFPFFGLPGTLILFLAKPIANLVYGPLAFEASLRALGPFLFGGGLVLSVVWPFSIPLAYFAGQKYFPNVPVASLKKISFIVGSAFLSAVVLGHLLCFVFFDFKRLTDKELVFESIYADRVDILASAVESFGDLKHLEPDPLFVAISENATGPSLYLIGHRDRPTFFSSPSRRLGEGTEEVHTPLHMAVDRANLKIMEALLKRKADPNSRNDSGQTPVFLLTIIEGRKGEELALLKRYGSDLLTRDNDGNTLLHALVEKNGKAESLPDYIKLLIDAGVDPGQKNKHGETGLDIARKNGDSEAVALLKLYAKSE